jgi:hypothetical protein
MSAYQVDTDTIDLIVSALTQYDWQGERGASVSLFVPDGTVTYTEAARQAVQGGRFVAYCADQHTPDLIGRELVAANCASVAARYPQDTHADRLGGMIGYLPADYKFRRVSRDLFADYPHALAALACYEYQSCETGDATLADIITDRARRTICQRIADEAGAVWSWSRDWHREQLAAKRAQILETVRG